MQESTMYARKLRFAFVSFFACLMLCSLLTNGSAAENPVMPIPQGGDAESSDLWCSPPPITGQMPVPDRSQEVLTYSGSTLWAGSLDIEVIDSIALVLNVNGLQVFNISDLSSPVLLENIYLGYGSAYDLMFRDGVHLYVGRYDRLHILDVTEPCDPQELSVITLPGRTFDIVLAGDRAYIGIIRSYLETDPDLPGLCIYDVSDLSSPTVISKYESPWLHKDCRRFAVVGNYIYSVNQWDDVVEVISIADETRPSYVSSVTVEWPYDLAYYQGHIYVLGYDLKLHMFDISDSDTLVEIGTYDTPSGGRMIDIRSDYLYLTKYMSSESGIVVYDVSTPGIVDSVSCFLTRCTAYSLTFDDSMLFIPEYVYGFVIADASDLAAISSVGTFSHKCTSLRGCDVAGDYACLTNCFTYSGEASPTGVRVVDVSDKQRPEVVTLVETGGNPRESHVNGSVLCIAQCQPTNIYSLSDPGNPVLLSSYSDYTANNIVQDSVLFVISWGCGLHLVNISQPAAPVGISSICPDGFSTLDAIPMGDYLYIAAGGPGGWWLLTADISDVAHPAVCDSIFVGKSNSDLPQGGFELLSVGGHLYFVLNSVGVVRIDIGNPSDPDVESIYYDDGDVYIDADYRRSYLFLTCWESRIKVLDLADPFNPQLLQIVQLPTFAERLAVEGDYLHVATQRGFYIFSINLPPVGCGDANASGSVDIDDAVFLIAYIFSGGPAPDPLEAGDVDCSGGVDIDDVVYLIMYIFVGGPAPCEGC